MLHHPSNWLYCFILFCFIFCFDKKLHKFKIITSLEVIPPDQPVDLVTNSRDDCGQFADVTPLGGRARFAVRAQGSDVAVGAAIPLNAYRSNRQELRVNGRDRSDTGAVSILNASFRYQIIENASMTNDIYKIIKNNQNRCIF